MIPRTLNHNAVYDVFLPTISSAALAFVLVLIVRQVLSTVQGRLDTRGRLPKFGRKGLIISACSALFAASCVYRAIFVADEGASLCRSAASRFNAPASGRLIATIGELALVAQLRAYLVDTAARLGVREESTFSRRKRNTMLPAVAAETLSWCGVLSGVPQFYCAEYLLWCVIGAEWAWDAAELLHKSNRRGDGTMHASILIGSISLLAFNVLHELPHFFYHHPIQHEVSPVAETFEAPPSPPPKSPWTCVHDHDSTIWTTRLPFFVCYFFVCSWCSVGIAARYFYTRGGDGSSMPRAGRVAAPPKCEGEAKARVKANKAA